MTAAGSPDGATKVAGIFGFLADRDFHGYSRLYEHLARRVAQDDVIPSLVTEANQRSHAPVLFFACVQDILLREPDGELAGMYRAVVDGADPTKPDVWPAFRAFVVERADEVAELLGTRQVQTNEVGRAAALVPALATLAALDGRPIGLIELGASAGLNMLLDRYRVDYVPTGQTGPDDSPVHLRCELRGTRRPPIDGPPPVIASRLGVDRSPVDVRDDAAVRWLRACIWPDVADRAERFDAAVSLARADPPEIWTGDIVEQVERAVDTVPDGVLPCLVSTWVLAYLKPEHRRALQGKVESIARQRPVAYVTAEYEMTVPWLEPVVRRPSIDPGEVPTRLSLALWDGARVEQLSLAWMHAHALWIEWLDER